MIMRKIKIQVILSIMAVLMFGACIAVNVNVRAEEKYVKTVKIGRQVKLKADEDDVRYKCTDSTIACVDKDGIVTGKQEGTTTVSVIYGDEVQKKYTINVEKRKRKPENIPVAISEISREDISVYDETTGVTRYQYIVTNNAEYDKVKKIIYYYSLNDNPEEIVTLTAYNLEPEDSIEAFFSDNMPAEYNGSLSALTFIKVAVYSGKAIYI